AIGGLIIPLGARFKRPDPTDPDKLVPFGLQAWITVYLGKDPFLPGLGLPGIPQIREAQGLPPIVFQHPKARSTGPYTAPPGRPIQFDAGPSEDPNDDPLAFTWDLDGDGDFDDGNTRVVEQAFDEPGTRLVGLKATDPSGNSDVQFILLKIGDLTTQEIVVLFDDGLASTFGGARDLLRVNPEGVVSLIREVVTIPTRGSKALQVDLNGDIFILRNTAIFRFNSDGVLIETITPEQVGDLIGVPININPTQDLTFSDMVLDGRGDIILAAFKEDPDTFPPILVRLAPDATQASIITDDFNLGPLRPSVAIDPNGNIVIGGMADPDVDDETTLIRGQGGVLIVDPVDGSVEEVIPATSAILPDGKFQDVIYLFGGVDLGQAGNDALGDRLAGGIAVDAQGNYIGANGGNVTRSLGLYRVPIPPLLSVLVDTPTRIHFGLEIFPLHFRLPGGDQLFFSDIEIDRGGDYLVAARNLGPGPNSNRHGVYRISPVGETFLVADLRPHAPSDPNAPALAVVPEVREVTAKDIPAPPLVPQLQLANLQVNQEACPGAAQVGVTLTNRGASAVEHPVRVYFFDGDPLADGVAIGTAVAEPPIHPGASVGLSIEWPDPNPGVHQVFAMALGTNSPFAAFMVCIPEPPPDPILLEPAAATNPVGMPHTVTATVTDLLGNPIPGLPITFDVTGANTTTGEATTDASGRASFTYGGANPGQDDILATSFGATSNTAVKIWEGALNRPPVADAGGPYEGDEGSPITLDGSGSSDPDDSIVLYEWDLDNDGEFDDATGVTTAVVFDEDGLFAVGLRVTDELGESDTDSAEVTVNNLAPAVEAGTDQMVDEGDAVSLTPATFTDPGILDTHTATIDWRDGSPVEAGIVGESAGTGTVSGSHVYADDGLYTVTVEVCDDDGGCRSDTFDVTVANVPPTVDAGLDRTANEGAVVNLAPATFNDLGTLDTHTASINWGNGSPIELGVVSESPFGPPGSTAGAGGTASFGSHVYADNGSYTVEVCVTDDDGGAGCDTLQVVVLNAAPSVNAGPDATNFSGDTHNVNANFQDPGINDEPWSFTIDWGDNTSDSGSTNDQSAPITESHQYLVPGSYTVEVCVTDKDGGKSCDSHDKTVERLPVVINNKPGSDPNSINLRMKAVPVAILTVNAGEYGTPTFDATQVVLSTLVWGTKANFQATNGGGGTEIHGKLHIEDAEELSDESTKDGDNDVVLHMTLADSGIGLATTDACVWGETTGGVFFAGCDALRVVK
ncbi:MAG: PKD domain-containing protein, partial [Dehalococcoidia bacterium]